MDIPQKIRTKESEERSAFCRTLMPGAHIHVSGICGTGMAAVAGLLKQLGFRVTGSDKAFYPPMGDVVRSLADKIYEGYSAENLLEKPALVVIGNNLRRDNPESVSVREQQLPYASMPEVFEGLLIGSRETCPTSIVVTGTHGKTTTSAAVATMFDQVGWRPGYFIGGVPNDLPGGVRAVDTSLERSKRVVVLEGDEYDSAYFAKWAKFHSYRPDIAIITSIEFDHADIYHSLEEIEAEFGRMVSLLPETGTLLLCDTGTNLPRLAEEWRPKAKVAFYGTAESSAYRLLERTPSNGGQKLIFDLAGQTLEVVTSLSGPHNALNLLASAAAGLLAGLTPQQVKQGLEGFHGVRRRQQVIYDHRGVLVIEDFAHHPSAVAVTLQGLREANPGRRIRAIYEPRSNTSRRGFFQAEYPASFDSADEVVLLEVTDAGTYSNTGDIVPLNVAQLVAEIQARGKNASFYSDVKMIESYIVKTAQAQDLIVLMSNGDFGGLIQSLPKALG